MSVHPAYVERFPLLDGISSFEELMSDPALEERFLAFMQWPDAAPAPAVTAVDVTRHLVPGVLHGFLNLPAEVEPVGHAFQLIADAVATPALTAQEASHV
ncbi:hypothetical protein [Nocardioides conyzicola]|uniref:Tetracyclin repressor-like C-terminal domain-containing protein n=1 Tax=Nocardioides conyzicola TaxID=1651781 RepID=A0ABP8XAQ4_9ACTN